MDDKVLIRALHAADAFEVERAPKRHQQRKPDCPPLTRFSSAVRDVWTPQERKHVTRCPYCQRVTALEWPAECPHWVPCDWARYLEGESPDQVAMKYHLERDRCPRCQERVSEAAARERAIDDFIEWCDQDYDDYMDLTVERAEEIARKYFAPFRNLTNESVCRILKIMRASIERYPNDRAIKEWKGCCVGVANYLLRPADLDGVDREACARALQRFSGWYHTSIPFFSKFQPPAEKIGNMLYYPGGEGLAADSANPEQPVEPRRHRTGLRERGRMDVRGSRKFLRYLKIGEEWSFDQGRLDRKLMAEDGSMALWDFAQGIPNQVRTEAKLEEETRALASRLLNFLCERHYPVEILKEDYQEIVEGFPGGNTRRLPRADRDRRRHPLLRWSIDSDFIDLLTQRLIVKGVDLLEFLQQNRFNPDVTYNPDGEKRLAWFGTWKVIR